MFSVAFKSSSLTFNSWAGYGINSAVWLATAISHCQRSVLVVSLTGARGLRLASALDLFTARQFIQFIHFIHPCTYSSRERDFYSLWGSTPTRRICRNPGVASVEATTDTTMDTTMDTDNSTHTLDHLTCHNHKVPVSDI